MTVRASRPLRLRLVAAGIVLLTASCAAPASLPSSASPASSGRPGSSAATSDTPARAPAAVLAGRPEMVADIAAPRRPPGPTLVPRLRLALVGDPCTDRDLAAPAVGDPIMTILDRTYALPAGYVPDDLVPASEAGLTGTSGTKLVRAPVIPDLAAMSEAWTAAGLTVMIESAYRSYAAQRATFDSWVARVGVAEALRRSARPGHSEHQLGTAFDLTSPGWGGRLGDWALESSEGAWMVEHAWEYGFVMSYPLGSEPATCFGYEPWHWRWVGRDAAAAHRESGLTLREFLVRSADG